MAQHFQVVVVGGGTAGISVAARLRNLQSPPQVAIVEPAEKHYYQPLWTLVGGGVFPREESERDEGTLIPAGATWIKDRVTSFDPPANAVTLASGEVLTYDALVVCPGLQCDWGKVEGLEESLGKDGVCSNYSYDTVNATWDALRAFKGGKAVFTFPATPIKCAGAPQKIMYLADDHLRRTGVRDRTTITYASATAGIFGVPRYAQALNRVVADRGIQTEYQVDLVALRPERKEAVFKRLQGGDDLVLSYDLIHVTPPQSAPDFIKRSPLANGAGWVDVHKHTLQHVRYANVFGLGDAGSTPNSKTGAAIRKQAPVVVDNLLSFLAGRPLDAQYDGYASCPLVTGYGRLILAEFGYDGVIMETFPFDQSQERYSMYALKAYGLPNMYWHGMLRGRM